MTTQADKLKQGLAMFQAGMRKKIAGQAMIDEGQAMIKEGDRDMKNGRKLIEEAEAESE